MLHSKSLMKECFWEKCFHLKVLGFLTIFFWQDCQGCILRYNMKSLEKNFVENFIIYRIFTFPIIKFTSFLWAFCNGVGKTALYVSRGDQWADVGFEKLLELYFLSDFQRKIIWQFQCYCQNFLYLSRRKFFLWKLFFIRNFVDAWRLRSEIHRNFNEIFWAWLSKLLSKCLQKFFDCNGFW